MLALSGRSFKPICGLGAVLGSSGAAASSKYSAGRPLKGESDGWAPSFAQPASRGADIGGRATAARRACCAAAQVLIPSQHIYIQHLHAVQPQRCVASRRKASRSQAATQNARRGKIRRAVCSRQAEHLAHQGVGFRQASQQAEEADQSRVYNQISVKEAVKPIQGVCQSESESNLASLWELAARQLSSRRLSFRLCRRRRQI